MTEDEFLKGLIILVAETDEERLRICMEITHGITMDQLYPYEGSEFN